LPLQQQQLQHIRMLPLLLLLLLLLLLVCCTGRTWQPQVLTAAR
jgi:ABC-type cobalamin transport system permease subunit